MLGVGRFLIKKEWRRSYSSVSRFQLKGDQLPGGIVDANGQVKLYSIAKGPTSTPLLTDSIPSLWRKQVHKYSSQPLITSRHQNIRWTWSDLNKQANAFASGLKKLGYVKGDRLGVWLPNDAEWTVCQIATAKLGVIMVNVNPAYKTTEIKHSVNLVGIKGLVLTPQLKSTHYLDILSAFIPDLSSFNNKPIESEILPSLKHIIQTTNDKIPGTIRYSDVLEDSGEIIDESITMDDPINIQFTSGTTGQPKGTVLTHKNILNNGYFSGQILGLDEKHSICVPVPLFHCFGCVIGNIAAFTNGSQLVYPSATFDTLSTLEAVEKEKCTTLYGVPTMFISELQHPDYKKYNLSSLKNGVMAGSPCPIELMKTILTSYNLGICYGMTETSPVSLQTKISDPLKAKCETVGRVHDHLEVKVVDLQGNVLPIGQKGELCVRGYSVMKGYWNDPKKTKEVLDEEGWMHTGDLATMDQNGYCSIVGRIKDMIIRGGENIFPREVEEFYHTHPNVAQVEVIGLPDEKYGQDVAAVVVAKKGTTLTEKDLVEFSYEKIAHYKIPRHFVFVDKIPDFAMTASGKVQKYKLSEGFKK